MDSESVKNGMYKRSNEKLHTSNETPHTPYKD